MEAFSNQEKFLKLTVGDERLASCFFQKTHI